MAEPLTLPETPSNGDLAKGLIQTHECLEKLRTELKPVILASKFIVWAGPIVAAAIIGGIVQTWTSSQVAAQNSSTAAATAKHADATQVTVVRKLNSLGAAP
jgi:hypothetical protein